MVYDGRGDIASLLTTDTGDAGTSPHVARKFFQWYFHDKYCYLYIVDIYMIYIYIYIQIFLLLELLH